MILPGRADAGSAKGARGIAMAFPRARRLYRARRVDWRGQFHSRAGPFLAYDRQGNLVSSIYMIPLKDMNAQKAFAGLKTGKGEQVDHVDVVFNAGHPGVAEPHYHFIL